MRKLFKLNPLIWPAALLLLAFLCLTDFAGTGLHADFGIRQPTYFKSKDGRYVARLSGGYHTEINSEILTFRDTLKKRKPAGYRLRDLLRDTKNHSQSTSHFNWHFQARLNGEVLTIITYEYRILKFGLRDGKLISSKDHPVLVPGIIYAGGILRFLGENLWELQVTNLVRGRVPANGRVVFYHAAKQGDLSPFSHKALLIRDGQLVKGPYALPFFNAGNNFTPAHGAGRLADSKWRIPGLAALFVLGILAMRAWWKTRRNMHLAAAAAILCLLSGFFLYSHPTWFIPNHYIQHWSAPRPFVEQISAGLMTLGWIVLSATCAYMLIKSITSLIRKRARPRPETRA